MDCAWLKEISYYLSNNPFSFGRYLSSNMLTSLLSDSFIGLPNLTLLSEFVNDCFVHSLSIVVSRRSLEFNSVSLIESGAFNGLGNLNILYAVESCYVQS